VSGGDLDVRDVHDAEQEPFRLDSAACFIHERAQHENDRVERLTAAHSGAGRWFPG
jgi:hypothetical protein